MRRFTNSNYLCPFCLTVTKQNLICGHCGNGTIEISSRCRVPKKDAPKKRWIKFMSVYTQIQTYVPAYSTLGKILNLIE